MRQLADALIDKTIIMYFACRYQRGGELDPLNKKDNKHR